MAGNNGSTFSTQNSASTVVTNMSTSALSINTARLGWIIQNLGTNILYVYQGSGATTSVFSVALKAGSSNDDGTGGSYIQESGVIYNGVVTVAGTSPRYVITEMAP